MKSNIKYYLKIAGMLFLICAITAFVLAAVYSLTSDKIAQNEIEAKNNSIAEIFEKGIVTESVTHNGDENVVSVYKVTKDSVFKGYAVHVRPMGFKDVIEMMVGVNPDGSCKNVKVISLSETPGLGTKVAEEEFINQFVGKNGAFEVKKNIDAVAGATVSSKAATKGINSALDAVNKILTGGAQ